MEKKNNPEASYQTQYVSYELADLSLYQEPILAQAIITYQSLMLIANALGSLSLITLTGCETHLCRYLHYCRLPSVRASI